MVLSSYQVAKIRPAVPVAKQKFFVTGTAGQVW